MAGPQMQQDAIVGGDAADRLGDARIVLDRAHAAARSATATELRQSLEEARDLLRGAHAGSAARLDTALAKFDEGALVEMDAILEEVRRNLAQDI